MAPNHIGSPVVRSSVNAVIPSELKQQAIQHNISFSKTLEEALKQKIANLEIVKGAT